MRPDTMDSPSPYSMHQVSPKASCVWSTERRLLERPPPCAPRKSGRRISSSAHTCDSDNFETLTKKQRNDRLLLPSRTINEDDESPIVTLSFRRTNLTSMFNNVGGEIGSELINQDPTTVLLIPEASPLPWYDNNSEDDENDNDDMILSPRLFHFGQEQQHNLSCYSSIDLADENISESNNIFRDFNNSEDDDDDNDDENEGIESRDFLSSDTIQRRNTWTHTTTYGVIPASKTIDNNDDNDRN
jgi:hypothetical protein